MKTLLILLMLSAATSALAQSKLNFKCDDGTEFWASFNKSGSHADLHYEGEVFKLARVVTASGEKFSDGNYSLWMKGNEASLWIGERKIRDSCGERSALSPREQEMLHLPVRSFTELEIAWFNEHIAEAAARGETWTLNPIATVERFLDAPGAAFENITCSKTPIESPRQATVTIIRGWFADDSLRATWHRIELERMDFGRWKLSSASRAYLCQRGNQTEYFSADLCP
ncbi:MliC family protein [bacterium]|nr:MliC family protein [bacterium]